MTVEIELDGVRRTVHVGREAGGWALTVDGRAMAVTTAEAGGRWSVLVGARSYEVTFDGGPAGAQIVHVNGEAIPLTVLEPRALAARRRHDGATAAGPTTIAAPMPGRIVKVLVQPGEAVAARQGVIVVEAMKMENELRAPRAGTVTEVRAGEGASVEAGAVLVVLQ